MKKNWLTTTTKYLRKENKVKSESKSSIKQKILKTEYLNYKCTVSCKFKTSKFVSFCLTFFKQFVFIAVVAYYDSCYNTHVLKVPV